MHKLFQLLDGNGDNQRVRQQNQHDQYRVLEGVGKIVKPLHADEIMHQEDIRGINPQEFQDVLQYRNAEKKFTAKAYDHQRDNSVPEAIQG